MTQGSETPSEEREGLEPQAAETGEPVQPAEAPGVPAEAPAGEQRPAGKGTGKSAVREWVETLVIALAVALLIRAFVVQVYMVEGPSMEPTLHTAERVLVNKFVYRFRGPRPGEIIVLQDPNRPDRELIKRVIATGGETIEVKKSVVYVDGKPLKEPVINTVVTRPEDVPPQQVPKGYIFVMGDNRSWSFDSRAIGPIAVDKVDGKAFFMFWPVDRFGYGPLDQPRTADTSVSTTK
jgi:signal peptidase I